MSAVYSICEIRQERTELDQGGALKQKTTGMGLLVKADRMVDDLDLYTRCRVGTSESRLCGGQCV